MTLVQHLSESNDWQTPEYIVNPARELMGGIDLDPASCLVANETIKAKRIYDVADNGLTKLWSGKVFLNPPGGKLKWNGEEWIPVLRGPGESSARIWWQILANQYESGAIDQAFFVAFTLEILRSSQKGIPVQRYFRCYPSDRINFVGAGDQPGHGNVLIWLPPKQVAEDQGGRTDLERFRDLFSPIGYCEAGSNS